MGEIHCGMPIKLFSNLTLGFRDGRLKFWLLSFIRWYESEFERHLLNAAFANVYTNCVVTKTHKLLKIFYKRSYSSYFHLMYFSFFCLE